MLRSDCEWFPNHNVECKVMAELRCFLNGDLPCGTYGSALFLSALSENLTEPPFLRNCLYPLHRDELDVGHCYPLGFQ